jgi:hypothetical protein
MKPSKRLSRKPSGAARFGRVSSCATNITQTQPECSPMQAAMLPVALRTSPSQDEYDTHRHQRQERIGDSQRPGECLQRAGEQCDSAVRRDLLGGDVVAGEEVRRGVDQCSGADGGARPRLACDRGLHGTAQEGLLDEPDRQTAERAQRDQLGERAGAEARAAAPVEQPEQRHDANHRQHRDHPERQPERQLAHEGAARQSVAETHPVGKTETARHGDEAEQQRQHGDALADAMEREVEMRMQQQPGGVSENCD